MRGARSSTPPARSSSRQGNESARHFPFDDDPERFVVAVTDFIATTAFDEDRMQRLLHRRDT
jgi:hypothetical protein